MQKGTEVGSVQTDARCVCKQTESQVRDMHSDLARRNGYRKGVQRACKLPREAMQLGANSNPRWASDASCTFEVCIMSSGFACD